MRVILDILDVIWLIVMVILTGNFVTIYRRELQKLIDMYDEMINLYDAIISIHNRKDNDNGS